MADQNPNNPNQSGTGFVNLQQYLNANANNPLESAISSGINRDVQNLNQNVTGSEAAFNQQAQAGRLDTPENEQKYQGVLNRAENLQPGGDLSQQDYNAWNRIQQGYTGPQTLSNVEQLRTQAQDVQKTGQAAGSEAGRQGLLQRYVGGPSYTQGQKGLDTLLLGGSTGNQLRQAQRGTLGADQNITNRAQALANMAQSYQGQDVALQNQLKNQAQKAENDRVTAIQNALTGANTNLQDYNAFQNALTKYRQTGTYGDDIDKYLKQLYPNLTGYDLLPGYKPWVPAGVTVSPDYYLHAPTQATVQSITTPEQAAQIQALAKLSGQAAPIDVSGATGAYKPYSFDLNKMRADVNAVNAQYPNPPPPPPNVKTAPPPSFVNPATTPGAPAYIPGAPGGGVASWMKKIQPPTIKPPTPTPKDPLTGAPILINPVTGQRY